jgi:hypothetical protein
MDLSITFVHISHRLSRKGGLEYGLTFCRLRGVRWQTSCTPGLPEIQRDLPVVVNIVENDLSFDRACRMDRDIVIVSCDPENPLRQRSGCPTHSGYGDTNARQHHHHLKGLLFRFPPVNLLPLDTLNLTRI